MRARGGAQRGEGGSGESEGRGRPGGDNWGAAQMGGMDGEAAKVGRLLPLRRCKAHFLLVR